MRLLLSLTAVLGWLASPAGGADFALRDGDTVVLLGDSITAAKTYGKLIENYTLLRFPDRKVRFVNAGQGGDTAAGGLKRFEADVLVHNPTVVTVAYGINDIGWGTKADDAHKQDYLNGIRGIVEACQKRKIRVYICSAAVTAEAPAKAEEGYLQKMCDEGLELARSLGGNTIDVQRGMRAVQKRMAEANRKAADKSKPDTLHVADGVHLNDLGQLAMAFAILKGLDAPAEVSAVSIDATDVQKVTATGCKVSDAVATDGEVRFTRTDDGLPFNYGIFYAFSYRFVPVPTELNRYQLRVTGLPAGKYDVLADGRNAGVFTAEQLAAGENIASSTADGWQPGGPWNAQANALKELTDARHEIGQASRSLHQDLPKSVTAAEAGKQADDLDGRIVQMQRTVAKPRPYQFVIKRHEPSGGKK